MTSRNDETQPTDASAAVLSAPPDTDHAKHVAALEVREAALITRERSLKDLERQGQSRVDALEERERDLDATREKSKQTEAALAKRLRDAAAAESALEERARLLTQREIEAEAGFASRNREALAELTKCHAALRSEVQQVQAQIDAGRLQGVEGLDKWLAEERRVRLAALDADLQSARERAAKDAQVDLEKERARIVSERDSHDAALVAERGRLAAEQKAFADEVNSQRAAIAAKEAELHRDLSQLRWREEEVQGLRAGIENSITERACDQVSALERQLEALRDDHSRALDVRAALERRLDGHEQLLSRFDGNPEEVLRRLDDAAKKVGALEKELLARPSASDKERLIALQEHERAWGDERARILVELAQLRAEKSRWHVGVQEVEAQREQREVAERRLDVLRGEMEKYAADVDRMRSLYEQPEERDARVGAIEDPWRTDFKRAADDKDANELAWLDGIVAACESSGMRFPKRLVHAFHTSLKAAELSPLTVLAGVSGTGKSALPQLYSRFGGLAFLSLAVQPNWDSPQSLFGFFNSVDNRFNATTVLRAMVQAQHAPDHEKYRHGLSDRLLLVLLDEMNLAHIEQYFSDLLSRLEQRRGESRGVTLDIDLGAGMPPYPLSLGRNVMWVGTMNEDETTKALSDKVVDRSNLLYFPRPRTLHSRVDVTLAPEVPLLAESTWRQWLQTRSPFTPADVDPFRHALEEINGHLEHVGRALGHRVWQAVEYYMANHPEAIDARARGDQEALHRAMRRAYEDQLVLKVMPKLRGIETTGDSKRNCLDPIRKQLEDANLGLGLSEDFDIACRVGYGAFVWNSARYLENAE